MIRITFFCFLTLLSSALAYNAPGPVPRSSFKQTNRADILHRRHLDSLGMRRRGAAPSGGTFTNCAGFPDQSGANSHAVYMEVGTQTAITNRQTLSATDLKSCIQQCCSSFSEPSET
jgi:hypothetical protein